jgi:hypothetical protein
LCREEEMPDEEVIEAHILPSFEGRAKLAATVPVGTDYQPLQAGDECCESIVWTPAFMVAK